MELTGLSASVIVLVTIAVVNRIKEEAPDLRKFWYTLMSFGIGAIVYTVSYFAPPMVQTIFFIGLAASGIFDIFKSLKNSL